MGLHNTAHYLKQHGRGDDTELVHMTKGEVKGLQELAVAHGGSLTINPQTGLVEAGFLSRMLPTVAGIAAGVLTENPAIGMAVAGGLTMATGGSLTQGLIAGVGAYGGAGAFAGLAEAGATQLAAEGAAQATQTAALEAGTTGLNAATTSAAANAASSAVDPIAAMNASQGWTGAAGSMSPTPLGYVSEAAGNFGPGLAQADTISSMPNLTPEQSAALKGQLGQNNLYSPVETAGRLNATAGASPLDLASAGAKSTFSSGPSTMDFIKNNATNLGMLAVPAFMGDNSQPQGAYVPPTEASPVARISPNFSAYVAPQPTTYYKAQYPNYKKYAEGGIAMAVGGQPPVLDYLPKGDAGKVSDTDVNTRGLSAWEATQYRNKKLMAKSGIKQAEMPSTGIKSLGGDFSDVGASGGIATLGGYSDGGRMLKGPGDGMSDSIPAQIGSKQPARLADGEFVVPADVVSHLGNGSTDAGAKKLYAMMDKIRAARTGKKKQAPAVKANKFLPV